MSAVGGSPWARTQLLRDEAGTAVLVGRAKALGVDVFAVGSGPRGPWIARVSKGPRVLTFRGHVLADVIAFGLDRWAAGADDTGIAWRAGADTLAHAHPGRGRVIYTLCKLPAISEQLAHPERARCDACWRALDRKVVAA